MNNALPLFYKNPVVLNSKQHTQLGIKAQPDFAFAKNELSIPVVVSEFMPLVRHFPIVFTRSETPTAVAILGVSQNKNTFIHDGQWDKHVYIPAYIRRYPFIFVDATIEDNTQRQFLSLDLEATTVLTQVEEKEADRRLFNDDGTQTKLAESALAFCEHFHQHAVTTQAFINDLKKHDLLTANALTIKEANNEEHKIDGFMLIDQSKFAELGDDVITDFHKKGWLALIALQMASQQNWQLLIDRNHSA